ncbi:hypothetical protein [Aeromicrobium sp. UC242_57]|uniref:hypothetical protein n=1 Tax=Aeromicrobium sp. UC242_57 TaxID=3374624 RepID=UPI00379BEFF3
MSEDPLQAALALVEQIVERSPDSVAATEQLIYGTRHASLRGAYRLERRLQAAMFKARNTSIARKAGAAKEKPVFRAPDLRLIRVLAGWLLGFWA